MSALEQTVADLLHTEVGVNSSGDSFGAVDDDAYTIESSGSLPPNKKFRIIFVTSPTPNTHTEAKKTPKKGKHLRIRREKSKKSQTKHTYSKVFN